jgi:general secretion pathway protein D
MSRSFPAYALALLAAILFSATVCTAADEPSQPPVNRSEAAQTPVPQAPAVIAPCPENAPDGAACEPTKSELKQAKSAFNRALKLQKNGKLNEAFPEFEAAARLAPKNLDYVTAREMARQQLVYNHLQSGNDDLLQNHSIEAMAEFRNALYLDPDNSFAAQRLRGAVSQFGPHISNVPRVIQNAGEILVQPNPDKKDFSYRGDSRGLLTQVAAAYGVKTSIDDSVTSRQVRFEVTDVDFYTAINLACAVTKTFWTPLQSSEILLASDTPENHRLFDRMVMRTFYFPGTETPTDITDLVGMLKTVFQFRYVGAQTNSQTIVVRGPQVMMDAATKLLESMDDARPQVMLDVNVYEISHTFMRSIGVQIPNQFNLFNIPAGALAALAGQNIQDLINQLIASGGINQANSQSLSALLAQLQNQQNSIFSQPLATFGNGTTLMGLSLGTLSAQASLNDSSMKNLEHAMLLASEGNQTDFRMGTRYPVLNASFSPIANSPAIAGVIANNSFQAPFPSFSYEDLGLDIKAKPFINTGDMVSLDLELQFRTLLAQSFNGIPVIANREYKGSISLLDGQPAVVAGAISHNEQKSLSGIPGLGYVPVLNQVMASNSKEIDDDELLIVITPRIVNNPNHDQSTAVWLQH